MLVAWTSIFGPHTPLCMQVYAGNSSDNSSSNSSSQAIQQSLLALLGSERLKPRDPIDCAQKIEMVGGFVLQ